MPRGLQLPFTEFGVREGDSPNESFDMESTTATRILDVDWNDRLTAAIQLLGYSYVDKSANDGIWVLKRVLPDFHPELPQLIATGVTTKGVGSRGTKTANGGRISKYLSARLTVKYEYPSFDVKEDGQVATEFDRYRTLEIEPNAEYMSPPQTGFLKWSQGADAGKPYPGNVGYIMGTLTFKWDWLQVPFEGLPFNTIRRRVGCVNSDTFAGCEPGTLLLVAPKIRRVNSPFQIRTWTISYFAVYVGQEGGRPGHNWFYNFNENRWSQASVDGVFYPAGAMPDGKCLYNERKFKDLFNVNSG